MDKKGRINEAINMRKIKGWMKGRKNKWKDEWKKRRNEWKEDWKNWRIYELINELGNKRKERMNTE